MAILGNKAALTLALIGVLSMGCQTFSHDGDKKGFSKPKKKASIVLSLSNNSMTSSSIDQKAASNLIDDADNAEDAMAAKTLGKAAYKSVFAQARRLMKKEMAKNVDADMAENAKWQLALSAINEGRYTMAEHFLSQLSHAKNRSIKAAALNLEGLLALAEGRTPEAAGFWKKALKIKPDYKPARINIGFVAIKFGDYKTARKMLAGIRGDWFSYYGMIVVERAIGKPQRVASYCKYVLAVKPEYKPALFSCALNEYYGLSRKKEARKLASDYEELEKGPASLDRQMASFRLKMESSGVKEENKVLVKVKAAK